jgi:hypothetical protein
MLEMMTSKMTIDLNVLSSLIKTELWAIWIELWLSQFIGVGWEKKTLILTSNQRNQTISLVVNAMTKAEDETDRNTKLQKLKDSRNTRFCRSGRQNITPNFFFFFCRNWTQIPNCRNWKEEEIPNCRSWYQITETEEKKKYQNNCRDRTKIPNCRSWYQIAETEEKTKYRDRTEIPNCRSWRI